MVDHRIWTEDDGEDDGKASTNSLELVLISRGAEKDLGAVHHIRVQQSLAFGALQLQGKEVIRVITDG